MSLTKRYVATLALGCAIGAGPTAAQTAKDTEWPSYAADLRGSHYRPLDQINAANFSKLEVAWRFKR